MTSKPWKLVALLAALACSSPAQVSAPPQLPGSGAGSSVAPASSDPPLALWPAVVRGTLPNGLTYYVLQHGKPEKRAYLWLAVNAGSVQEDDDQRGLAHFVEHMGFNGTKRFPKQDLVNYLESIGMRFGPDLNASTNFDETVYQLLVPTDSPATIGKGFDILRDWAADMTFDPVEVDKERGVVLEEWRLGRGAAQRLIDKLITVVFGESRYAVRLPIGLPEVLKTAPRDKLVRFYKDWYRPDRMAVIAVGDFADTAAIEREIASKFGDLPKATNPRAATPAGVPKATGTRVAIGTDKELPVTVVGMGNLIAHQPEATAADFRRGLAEQLYQHMMNERLQTIARRPDAPFTAAGVAFQSKITREIDAFGEFAIVKGDDVEGALRGLVTEVLRVERHGFTPVELERARTVLMRQLDQNATEAATVNGRVLTQELVRHFLTGEAVIGPDADRDLGAKLLPQITVAELHTLVKSYGGAQSRILAAVGPDGKPMPAKERLLAIVDEVGKAAIDPWVEKAATVELMKRPAWPGSIVKESTIAELGVTEWTLGNGVRVIVKPTDFEKDSVSLSGVSPGGLATASDKDFVHARFADDVAREGGAGELDADALGKALAGKQVSVNVDIGDVTESVYGNGSARDLETMLQLVYLKMTAPRRDEAAFGVWQKKTIEALTNEARSPDAEFARKSTDAMWRSHPRRKLPEPGDIKAVDLDKALAFYTSRFGDASDFTFVIVGAVELDKLKPLVEAYLGLLPGKGRVEKEKDAGMRRAPGVVKQSWNLNEDKDKARVQLVFHGDEAWTRDKDRDMSILGQVLSIRLREVLREDMGGVYGVGASGSITRSPRQERTFSIQFGCAPTALQKLVDAAFAEIATISKSGIDPSYLAKIKETYIRERETNMRTNRFWVDWLSRSARYGDDPKIILDPAPFIARMTSDNVKASATKFLDKKQLFEARMLPR